MRNETKQRVRWYRPLFLLLQGIVVGAGGILPGLSGGVLCVIFGLYTPMMELLARPFQTWKKHLSWVVPFGLGVAVGFFGVARVLEKLFAENELYVTCVFIGLILGTLPDLFSEGRKEGWNRRATITLCGGTVLFGALFLCFQFLELSLKINYGWSFLCGLLWGLSIIVPGMSSSSILMNIGLYEQMNAGISQFDFRILIPMGIGILLVIFLLAKAVNLLFERHYAIAFSVVLAAVIASTLTLIPRSYENARQGWSCLACIVCGALLAYFIAKISDYFAKKVQEKEQNLE